MIVTINVNPQAIEDLWITAFEGGSSYWAETRLSRKEMEGFVRSTLGDELMAQSTSELALQYMKHGGTIKVYDAEEGGMLGMVTYDKLKQGMQLLANQYPGTFSKVCDPDGADWDAWDADTWLQLSVMGEVVFG